MLMRTPRRTLALVMAVPLGVESRAVVTKVGATALSESDSDRSGLVYCRFILHIQSTIPRCIGCDDHVKLQDLSARDAKTLSLVKAVVSD